MHSEGRVEMNVGEGWEDDGRQRGERGARQTDREREVKEVQWVRRGSEEYTTRLRHCKDAAPSPPRCSVQGTVRTVLNHDPHARLTEEEQDRRDDESGENHGTPAPDHSDLLVLLTVRIGAGADQVHGLNEDEVEGAGEKRS